MSDPNTELAKLALEPITDMLKRIAGPLADEIGESLGVVARHYRFRLGVKMLQKTQRMLREAGITPQAVPPRLFLPILENASIQDDEDLHTRWAALLANAATSPKSVHPSYIEILKQLDPQDAALLDKLYDYSKETHNSAVRPWMNATYAEKAERLEAGDNPEIAFNNLVRLGLIEHLYEIDQKKTKVKVPIGRFSASRLSGIEAKFEGELEEWFELAEVAAAFVRACRAPKTIEAE
jgi:hypothetical protein